MKATEFGKLKVGERFKYMTTYNEYVEYIKTEPTDGYCNCVNLNTGKFGMLGKSDQIYVENVMRPFKDLKPGDIFQMGGSKYQKLHKCKYQDCDALGISSDTRFGTYYTCLYIAGEKMVEVIDEA